MSLLNRIKNLLRRFGYFTPAVEAASSHEAIHVSDDNFIIQAKPVFIGVDPAAPEGDTAVVYLSKTQVEQTTYPQIPVLKFENFKEAKTGFDNFQCDGSCHDFPKSELCFHLFEFRCPECLELLQFNVEQMGLFCISADENTVCPECWGISDEAEKLAA